MRAGFAYVLWLLAQTAWASAQTATGVEITKVGIYVGKVTGTRPAPGSPLGYTSQIDYHFIEDTRSVLRCKGVRFGFEYKLVGMPKGAVVALRKVTVFPPPGIRNPVTGVAADHSEHVDQVTIGGIDLKGYSFDEAWEAVPGRWLQQVWLGDRKLAEEAFDVTGSCREIS